MAAASPAQQKSPDAAVIKAVRAVLSDPDSGKFRDIRKTGADSYCGWVNAKNAYGGYAGDQLFYDDNGFVQILDLDAVFDQSDLAEQVHLIASGHDPSQVLATKARLSEEGKKVQLCLKDARP